MSAAAPSTMMHRTCALRSATTTIPRIVTTTSVFGVPRTLVTGGDAGTEREAHRVQAGSLYHRVSLRNEGNSGGIGILPVPPEVCVRRDAKVCIASVPTRRPASAALRTGGVCQTGSRSFSRAAPATEGCSQTAVVARPAVVGARRIPRPGGWR
jgi:hypothetical protein